MQGAVVIMERGRKKPRSRLFPPGETFLAQWREQAAYLVFGVLTTAVNYVTFWLLEVLWRDRYVLTANLLAFALAVAFAYVTNKTFVFQSRDWSWTVLRREAVSFVTARCLSFGVEEAGLWLAAYVLNLGRFRFGAFQWGSLHFAGFNGILLSKLFLSGVVMVLNYVFSKYLVFSRSADAAGEESRPFPPDGNGTERG